jgi:hypothetical protein
MTFLSIVQAGIISTVSVSISRAYGASLSSLIFSYADTAHRRAGSRVTYTILGGLSHQHNDTDSFARCSTQCSSCIDKWLSCPRRCHQRRRRLRCSTAHHESCTDHSTQAPDRNYTERLIRDESTQMFGRAMCQHITISRPRSTSGRDPEMGLLEHPSNASGLGTLYCNPQASLMTPMEWFLVVGICSEPFALGARIALVETRIAHGSLETLQTRHQAAVMVAADIKISRSFTKDS